MKHGTTCYRPVSSGHILSSGYCQFTVFDAESEIICWWCTGSHYGPSSHGHDCAGGSHAEAARENPQYSCSAACELVPRSNLTNAEKSPSDSESCSLVCTLPLFVSSDVIPSAIIFPLCMHSVALYCTQPVWGQEEKYSHFCQIL